MKKTKIAAIGAALILLAACGNTAEAPEAGSTAEAEATKEVAKNETKAETTEPAKAEEGAGAASDGGSEGEGAVTSPESIYEQITTAFEMPDMYIGNDDWIMNKYGIDAEELDGYVCAEGDETHVDRVFIVLPKADADTAALKDRMASELSQLSTGDMMDYMDKAIPGQSEYVKAATVKELGGYLYLFISPDAEGMEEILKSAVE